MEKNCINCKWYYNKQCNNSKLTIVQEDKTYWNIVQYIEEGILSQQIKESINLNKLGNDFLATIEAKDYIKKSCINKAFKETYEDDEIELYENLENIISKMLLNYFKNNGQSKINVSISSPENFYCCNWE